MWYLEVDPLFISNIKDRNFKNWFYGAHRVSLYVKLKEQFIMQITEFQILFI